jgi:hypothetical protein
VDRRRLLRRLPLLAAVWVALTAATLAGGARALLLAHPVFEAEVEALMPAYVARIQPRAADAREAGGDVVMVVHAVQPDRISGTHVVVPRIDIEESVDAGHELVPVILLLSLVLAWPWARWPQAARALALALGAAALVLAWTVPVHLAGLYEMNLQRVAASFNEVREPPWFLRQMIFFESGGQWLLALLLAAAIVLGVGRPDADPAVTRAPAR